MNNYTIILGTHGRFGEELIKSAELIVGKMNIQSVSLLPEMSFEDYLASAQTVLGAAEGKVISLVDLFGGTPCNVFTALSKKYHNEVITGVNLPMLVDLYLKISNTPEIAVDELVSGALTTLQESGVHTNKMVE